MREKAVVNSLRLVDGKERNREQNFLRIVSDYRARIAELTGTSATQQGFFNAAMDRAEKSEAQDENLKSVIRKLVHALDFCEGTATEVAIVRDDARAEARRALLNH
jgi:hypothetical protein